MRVVVNHTVALGPKTGIGHYTTELLRCLREQSDGIDTFPEGGLRRGMETFARRRRGSGTASANAWRGFLKTAVRSWSRAALAACFSAACRRGRYQVYHEPNYIPLPSDLPTVVSLHDLSVLLHPEWHPADRVAHFERHFHRGIQRGQHFLAISESGRQEIIHTLGIAPERVTRTYMGIRPGLGPWPPERVAAVLRELRLPSHYLLYLGTIEPRKNVQMLLRAYGSLPAPLRERWPLVLVGSWGWNAGNVADALARARDVIHLGYVPEPYLGALYNGARALVYPSLYEGFGLPPAEMLACGGAVLASTAAAVAETVGGQAHLIAPEDVDGWRAAMRRVLTDDEWWQSLRTGAVEAARPYTWENCAADTLRVYRALADEALPADAPMTTVQRRKAG